MGSVSAASHSTPVPHSCTIYTPHITISGYLVAGGCQKLGVGGDWARVDLGRRNSRVPGIRQRASGRTPEERQRTDFSFVQISDSHIGFNKPANPDVTATLQTAIAKIDAMPQRPDFIIHTGDLTQLSKPSEFDTLDQVLKGDQRNKSASYPASMTC
jgi:hypothetical protein